MPKPTCCATTVLRNGERHPCQQYATFNPLEPEVPLCYYHDEMARGHGEPAPVTDETGVDYVLASDRTGFAFRIYTYVAPDPDKEGLCPESEIATAVPKAATFATV